MSTSASGMITVIAAFIGKLFLFVMINGLRKRSIFQLKVTIKDKMSEVKISDGLVVENNYVPTIQDALALIGMLAGAVDDANSRIAALEQQLDDLQLDIEARSLS